MSQIQSSHGRQTVQLTGRTPGDRIVDFAWTLRQIGQFLPITIYDNSPHTLQGAVVTQHVGPEVFALST